MNDAPKRRSRVQQEQPVERTGSHRSRRSRGGRKNGKVLYYAVLVILVGVLVFSSVKIISYLKEQKDTERINDNINQDFISPDDTAGDTDTDGDGTDGDSQETQKPVKKDEESIKVDFTAMQAKYPDVVGYVYSANTTLQLPIVQSADEGGEYYLYRDIDGKDNKNGTVFLDIRCNSDFTSQNNLIYGHNMRDGSMFGQLVRYRDKAFCQAHPTFTFDTLYETATWQVAAVLDTALGADELPYYTFFDADNKLDWQRRVAAITEKSLYDTGVTPAYGTQLLTLSTCGDTRIGTDARFALLAVRVG